MRIAYTVASPEAKADRVLAWRAPLTESFAILADLGYEGVELMVRAPEDFDTREVQSVAEQHNLAIAAIGTGPIAMERGLSLSSPNHQNRTDALDAAKATIRMCAELGAMMTIGAFRGRCESTEVEASKGRFLDSLRQLSRIAEQTKVRICVEPQNRFQSSFLRTVDEAMCILKLVESEFVGLSLDCFHMNIEEDDIDSAVQRAGDSAFYVQLAENHRGAPGTGMFPFSGFMSTLRDKNYDDWLSMEITQRPSPPEAAAAAIRGFQSLSKQFVESTL